MAVGYSNISAMNSNYITALYNDAWFVARERNIMSQLVTVFNDRTGDETRKSATYPQITASSVTEDDDFSNPTQFTKTNIATLTPAEIMAQVLLTDRRLETDPQSARTDAALELGAAMADKMESDLLGDFSSFTGAALGQSGGTISWGQFFAARTQLRGAKVPGPYIAVLHEYQWHTLAKALAPAQTVVNNPDWLANEIARNWYVGSAGDVDIFVSANVPVASSNAYAGMYNRLALALDMRRAVRLEVERDASKRAWELDITCKYAHGVWRPLWGAYILSGCTAPTS